MKISVTTSDLLSIQQTALLLNRPRLTIYRWISARKLHAIRLGGTLYIPMTELTCSSCFHQTNTTLCACREATDIPTDSGKCSDWFPQKQKKGNR